jgi:heme exporter protein D
LILATFTWPVATVIAVAIATLGVVAAVWVWQTFAVVIRDDRQTERERRLQQAGKELGA